MKIKEIEWGFCYNYGDSIEINKNLRNYPDLYQFTMEHELKHTQKKGFNLKDLFWDIEEAFRWKNLKMVFKTWIFMFKHPKSLMQLIPFGIKDKKLAVDANRLIIYGLLILIIDILIKLWGAAWL